MDVNTYLNPKQGDPLLLVGTIKGAFLFSSDGSRNRWQISGPHFAGQVVYSLAYDSRAGRRRVWASSMHFAFGTMLHSSDTFGKEWTNPDSAPIKFPDDTGQSLKQIWQIELGGKQEPEKMYCGVEPAALFESSDAGETWTLVRGLFDHPHRPQWQPGGGGLCLHTIVPDPSNSSRVLIAVSTGGVYRTDDGGKSWQVKNQGITAEFLPNKYPEFGQCVHKVSGPQMRPERLFLQNHGGLFRSDNGGDSWQEISAGVPSNFGFPMVAHPSKPDTAYVFPLDTEMRCSPEAKMRVYRTQDAGQTWEALGNGMPQAGAYETVLRDGMAADPMQPVGIYFGTRSGKLYASRDEGENWQQIADGLPAVTCVKAVIVQ